MNPITILIAALGGEGGGVMADWLMDAATQSGFPAQATSIPGVAQRTGATTYYLEIYPAQREVLGGREPVLSLTPSPGNVDVMVASELIEAGRAMLNGYVSPERTTLIASTHRIYATVEKMQMADGRFESARVLEAARELAKRPVLFDMRKLARRLEDARGFEPAVGHLHLLYRGVDTMRGSDERGALWAHVAVQHGAPGLDELRSDHDVDVAGTRCEREHRLPAAENFALRRVDLEVIGGRAGALRDAGDGGGLRREAALRRRLHKPVGHDAAAFTAERGDEDGDRTLGQVHAMRWTSLSHAVGFWMISAR